MAGSYIEFTVNIVEESGTDSNSSINNKVKNNSDTDDELKRLNKQASDEMNENKPEDENSQGNKPLKSWVVNTVVKEATSRAISIAKDSAMQTALYGGSTADANAMSNTINTLQKTTTSATSVIGMSIAGAAAIGGPIRAIIGLTIGLVTETLDLITDYNKRNSEYQWNIQQDNLETNRNIQRLGRVTTNRGR